MVKKKVKKKVSVKKEKTSPKKEKPVKTGKENAPASKKKNPFIVPVIIAVVLMAIAAEIYFVVQKEMALNKKPVFVKKWKGEYKGQIGIPVYGDNLYVIDNQQNQVKIFDKMSGNVKGVIETKKTPMWAVQTSKGNVFVLVSGSNKLLKYEEEKKTGEIVLNGFSSPAGLAVDSTDNLYVSEHGTNKIHKFNLKGKKLKEFGGRGGSKDKFEKIGRIFTGPDDKIYALDYGKDKGYIKIFKPNGKLVNSFGIDVESLTGLENIAIMHDGNMYVNDFKGSQILVYNPGGKLISKFNYDRDGRFKIAYPGSISGGYDNRLYVASHAIGIFEAIEY